MPESAEAVFPCKNCGRKFIRASLDKHEPVCKKLSKLNRKPFDSGKQRATGSDVTLQDVRKAQKEKDKAGGSFPRPQTNWRERHTDFIEAVSASKKVDYALKTGAPLPPPPKSSVPSDYVQCEYCGRNFNSNAAERHIPFCREQHNKKGPLRPAAKPMSAHRPLPTSQQVRQREQSREKLETRSASHTRSGERRRSSTDSRPVQSRASPARPTANSAGTREMIPPTPARRSNSAPRTPAVSQPSRLKTPAPPRTATSDKPPKTPKPKTRDESRGRSSHVLTPVNENNLKPKTRDSSRGRDGLKTRDMDRKTSTSRSRRM